jgi:hypothetical protein
LGRQERFAWVVSITRADACAYPRADETGRNPHKVRAKFRAACGSHDSPPDMP